MPKPVVIFGAGQQAEVAHYYFRRSGVEVRAFAVDAPYVKEGTLSGLAVLELSEALHQFRPNTHDFHVAIGYSRLNRVRVQKCEALKAEGYGLASFVSPACEFHGTHGENAFILEHNTVQPFVTIGDYVVLWSGNHIGHHSRIGSGAFLTSHVVISGGCSVGANAFLGVNCAIANEVIVGENCIVGGGAFVDRNLAPGSVYTKEGLSKVGAHRVKL